MSSQTSTITDLIETSVTTPLIQHTPTITTTTADIGAKNSYMLNEQTPTTQTEIESSANAIVVRKEALPFYSPHGTRYWYPDVIDKPVIGTIYDTLDEAYSFYHDYAKRSGFVSKKSSSWNPDNVVNPRSKYFKCNREGEKNKRNSCGTNLKTRKTSSFRTGCQAKIHLIKLNNGKYKVHKFNEGHNHYLLHQTDMKFVRPTRNLGYMKQQFLFQVSTLNIGPVKGFKMLKELYGGFEEVGVTKVDCKNFRRDVSVFIGKADAQMAVEKLLAKMQFVEDFYVEYFLTPKDTLAGVFWADPEAHRNYRCYGDVVSFDSTFKSNTYEMVFVPFTGIDNHNRCVTFGSALLTSETQEYYEWLLKAFQRAFKRDPLIVVTDQDKAMKAAIKTVFTNTRHRLCMWHIMKKLTTKVGTVLCNTTDFKKRICNIVWTDKITPEVFEKEWESIIQDFKLTNNTWLKDIYNIRNTWIPAYLLHEPLAGLMRTSSRSESENHFFSKFTNPYLTLVEFLTHYDTAMEHQRYVQQKNDHETMYTAADTKTDLALEVSASALYTRTIFYEVQEELVASYTKCISLSLHKYENKEKYEIKDRDHDGKIYEVEYTPSEVTAICSCNNFDLYGLLCRHIFYVLRIHDIKQFPRKYLLKRWSVETIPDKKDIDAAKYEINTAQTGIREMLQIVEQTANRLVHDTEMFAKYREELKKMLEQTKVIFPTATQMNKKDAICSFYGIKQPDQVIIKNPDSVKTKGRKKKRLVSREEIEYNKAKKKMKKIGNQCKKCKSYGHNSRGCKDTFEESNNKQTQNEQANKDNGE